METTIACMYVCSMYVRAAFKGELLHLCSLPFVLRGKVFCSSSTNTWSNHFGGPVITKKAKTFEIDCASDGSRGM